MGDTEYVKIRPCNKLKRHEWTNKPCTTYKLIYHCTCLGGRRGEGEMKGIFCEDRHVFPFRLNDLG